MSKPQQEAAFRRFASTSPPELGLGLAIVHRLVTSNGGCGRPVGHHRRRPRPSPLDLPGGQPDRSARAGRGGHRAGFTAPDES